MEQFLVKNINISKSYNKLKWRKIGIVVEVGLREPTFLVLRSIMAAKKESIAERAEEILKPIAEECGVAIYDVDYLKEAYIDRKPDGVTIDDCEKVSRAYSDALDEADLIADAYILEVSSPGLGRQLKKDRHFAYCIGEEVEGKTFKEVNGSKDFTGILKAYDKDSVTIQPDGGEEMVFARKDLAVIRLTIDF